ncbi:hypothetical protein CAF53_16745 [Sphingobium sp. LB126]|nr:hypothetical protein CAF53_16745 [Sphingobium sp. LB126]
MGIILATPAADARRLIRMIPPEHFAAMSCDGTVTIMKGYMQGDMEFIRFSFHVCSFPGIRVGMRYSGSSVIHQAGNIDCCYDW